MADAETLYRAKDVAAAMRISPAMLRRWAAAYEQLTGTPIRAHKSEGRTYSQEQLDTLLRAKQHLDQHNGMSVDTALQLAMGRTGLAVPLSQATAAGLSTAVLAEALAQAQGPLLAELQGMRSELAALRAELGSGARETSQGGQSSGAPSAELQGRAEKAAEPVQGSTAADGPMVRAARWLEQRLRGRGGAG
jgi:DNA-binding transcriptional MerR regulator